MKDITEVAANIFRVETPILTAQYPSVTYIVKDEPVILVDPGPAASVAAIQDALKNLAIRKLDYILPTHLHMDHYGGAGALARLYPTAKVSVHPRYARHAIDPSRMIEAFKLVFGSDFEARFGVVEPVAESRLLLPADGEVVKVGDRELEFIHTPGHAPHHLSIYDRKSRGLYCGEALGLIDFQMPAAPPMSFDLEAYVGSIEKLMRLNLGAQSVFVSHGTVEHDVDAVMKRALENIRVYGDMVLKGVRNGDAQEKIERDIGADIERRRGVRVAQRGLSVTAAGLSIYFKSKGMV